MQETNLSSAFLISMCQLPVILEGFRLEVLTGRIWIRQYGRTSPAAVSIDNIPTAGIITRERRNTKDLPSLGYHVLEDHGQ